MMATKTIKIKKKISHGAVHLGSDPKIKIMWINGTRGPLMDGLQNYRYIYLCNNCGKLKAMAS